MSLFKNFLSLTAAEVFTKLATFAAFAYLARMLGASGYGQVEFAGAVLMCASLIVDQGFNLYGAREVARLPERTGRLVSEIVTARFVLAATGYLAILIFALTTDRAPVMTRLLLVYGLSLWPLPLLLQWVFQGHDQMRLVAIAQVIRQTVFALTVFTFVRAANQILRVGYAEVAGVTSAAAFCVWIYRRRYSSEGGFRPAVSRQLFREGVPIGLSQMFWVVKMFGGTFILGLIASAQSVGLYAGAQRILVALHAFVWLYYFNLLPSMSRLWKYERAEFGPMIERSLRRAVWFGSVAGLAWALLARYGMRVAYGPQFAAAGSVLALFAAVFVMTLINGHYRFGLIASGHQSAEMLTSAAGAIVAVVLIPIGYSRLGLNGAALGLVVAEAVIWLGSWYCARTMLGLRGHSSLLLRPLILSAIASGVWFLPLGAAVVRGTVALVVLSVLALALDSDLRKQLSSLAPGGPLARPRIVGSLAEGRGELKA